MFNYHSIARCTQLCVPNQTLSVWKFARQWFKFDFQHNHKHDTIVMPRYVDICYDFRFECTFIIKLCSTCKRLKMIRGPFCLQLPVHHEFTVEAFAPQSWINSFCNNFFGPSDHLPYLPNLCFKIKWSYCSSCWNEPPFQRDSGFWQVGTAVAGES